MLRHSGPANPVMRERWHKSLSKLLGRAFPEADEEKSAPDRADDIYNAAVKLQIGKTRDTKKYHLLYKENVQYGFCRNLLALRSMAVTIGFLSVLTTLAAGVWLVHVSDFQIRPWACLAVNGLFLFWWVFTVKPQWVRIPAFAYAERLFESTESASRSRKESAKVNT
jgi:hypothetical protein